ncbi:histone H3-like protein [Vairimorpha necatrix]|uniref:Histone H3-like protein n=1 Tax=Vairimorpha necatrix TaxID=6039 RepID=A0AAX4J826_9MICR
MARTAFSVTSQKGKGKKTPDKRSPPKKKRSSFSIRKPNITHSQAKKKVKKSASIVLKEIKFYQKSTGFLCSRQPFVRMMRRISGNIAKNTNSQAPRFTSQALEILQDVFETHLTSLMETSYLASKHAKRVTLLPSDIKLINKVKGYDQSMY